MSQLRIVLTQYMDNKVAQRMSEELEIPAEGAEVQVDLDMDRLKLNVHVVSLEGREVSTNGA